MRQQKLDKRRLRSLMWNRMSISSQAKVQDKAGFELVKLNLDSVKLWVFINKSHLTHVCGVDDNMRAVNKHDQSEKYNNLRQGDRECISAFKIRFDNQVKANNGVDIAKVDEESRAKDFLGKLDPKRYTDMLTSMMNGEFQNNTSTSYPTTLAGALRVASSWTTSGRQVSTGEQHRAFLTDTAFVTKAKDPEKGMKTPSVILDVIR